jgi:hypothetical protein
VRRIAYLLVAAFVLSGCGSVLTKEELKPQAPTLTQSRFVYLADRACRRFARRVKRHRLLPESGLSLEQKYVRYLGDLAFLRHTFMPANDRLVFELRALTPPPYQAVHYRRLLATLNYEDLVVHNFFQAADEAQIRRLQTLDRRIRRIGRQLDARAAKVGPKTCGKP